MKTFGSLIILLVIFTGIFAKEKELVIGVSCDYDTSVNELLTDLVICQLQKITPKKLLYIKVYDLQILKYIEFSQLGFTEKEINPALKKLDLLLNIRIKGQKSQLIIVGTLTDPRTGVIFASDYSIGNKSKCGELITKTLYKIFR